MVKKRFSFLASFFAVVAMMLALESFYWRMQNTGYIICGIFSVLIVLFWVLSAYFFFVKEKNFLLHGSVLLCLVLVNIIRAIYDYPIVVIVLLSLVFFAIYLGGYFLIKEDSVLKMNLQFFDFCCCCLGSYFVLSRFWGANEIAFMISSVVLLSGYLLNSLPKTKKFGLHILIGLVTAAACALLVADLVSEGSDFLFISIVFVLNGCAYFVLFFSKKGRSILNTFDKFFVSDNIRAETEKPEKQKITANYIERLRSLQKLREAGVLTDEEFQREKEKILGGKKNV